MTLDVHIGLVNQLILIGGCDTSTIHSILYNLFIYFQKET